MNAINATYKKYVYKKGMNEHSLNDGYKKYLEQLEQEKIEDVMFVDTYRVNKPSENFSINANDFNMFRTIKILQKEQFS